MVEVDVRDKSGVDPSELGGIERHASPQMPHPVSKDGIRHQANPVHLDQDSRVSDVDAPARDGLEPPGVARRVRRERSNHKHGQRDHQDRVDGLVGDEEEVPDRTEHASVMPTIRAQAAPVKTCQPAAIRITPKIKCNQPQAVTSNS